MRGGAQRAGSSSASMCVASPMCSGRLRSPLLLVHECGRALRSLTLSCAIQSRSSSLRRRPRRASLLPSHSPKIGPTRCNIVRLCRALLASSSSSHAHEGEGVRQTRAWRLSCQPACWSQTHRATSAASARAQAAPTCLFRFRATGWCSTMWPRRCGVMQLVTKAQPPPASPGARPSARGACARRPR